MGETQIPLELLSNFISVVILLMLLVKYYQYKKKMDVLKGLDRLKEQKKLTPDDKSFIQSNFRDYKIAVARTEQRLKLIYPVFILGAGILFAFLPFKEALIHFNVVVVAYIFLQVSKIHTRNFATLLNQLAKDLD